MSKWVTFRHIEGHKKRQKVSIIRQTGLKQASNRPQLTQIGLFWPQIDLKLASFDLKLAYFDLKLAQIV